MINNLHNHSKNLKYFQLINPISNKYINNEINFITGEKIQFYCDHFIGNKQNLNFNPNITNYNSKIIYLSDIKNNYNNKSLIYCHTHELNDITFLINKLRFMSNNFSLVFHNSDNEFNKSHLILFTKLTKLMFIYTQYKNINHINIIPIPICISNS